MSLSRFERLARIALLMLLAATLMPSGGALAAAGPSSSDVQVMQAFTEAQREAELRKSVPEQRKHLILFVMGLALLICLLTTAALGIAMAIYGKRVFIAHTVFAGFSVTLAIVHAVVAIVWFFPF